MMKLGDATFGMDGPAYDEFTQKIPITWAAQGRISRRDALQFVGFGTETVDLTGTIHTLFAPGGTPIGINTIRVFERMALDPQPYMMVDGTGRRYGYFAVASVTDVRTDMVTNGAPQKQKFTLNLKRYGEDVLTEQAVPADSGNVDLMDVRQAALSVNPALA